MSSARTLQRGERRREETWLIATCVCARFPLGNSRRKLGQSRQMLCRSATCGIGMAYYHDLNLDSLPYYDSDLTTFPFLRDRALDEIARELGTVPTQLHSGVPPDVELFEVGSVRDGWRRR